MLNGLIDDNELESIFVGLNKIDTVYGYFESGGNIVNNFIKAYNSYVAAVGYIEAKSEILEDLIVTSYMMDPICSAYFVAALTDYLEIEDKNDAFHYALNELLSDTAYTTYDMIGQKLVQRGVYNYVAEALGASAGSIGILTFTYNTTYKVLDFITANGEKGDLYKIMYAAAKMEDVLLSHVKDKGRLLVKNPDTDHAKSFDASWGLLQNIESYSYQSLSKYAAKSSLSTRFLSFFNKDYVSEDMTAPLYLASMWENTNCHAGTSNLAYKVVSVKCPTDVEVYRNNHSVLSIVNNQITNCAADITAIVIDDHKYVSLPVNGNYDIKITATDDGKMTYSISEFDTNDLLRYVMYVDIPLSDECVYTGSINDEINTEENNYKLRSDVADTLCSFDSRWGIHNDNGNHIFTRYISDENATCTNFGTKTAACDNNCGATNTIVDDSHYAPHEYINGKCECGVTERLIGDINGDGEINIGDVAKLYAHIKGTSILTDENDIDRCDITGDGNVNMGDVAKLYAHIKGTSKLY